MGRQEHKKKSESNAVKDVQSVCGVRNSSGLGCRGCIHQGEPCDLAIKYLINKVTKPIEINLIKED